MNRVGAQYLLPAVFLAALSLAPVEARGEAGRLSETPPIEDPVLRRQREIHQIVNRIREELTVNRNPSRAKDLCNQILAMDPENAEALFYLGWAERQLRDGATTPTRSPISLVPDRLPASKDQPATRSLPTTPTVGSTGASDGPTGGAPGRSLWLDNRYVKWIVIGLLGLVAVVVLVVVIDRLTARRRRRVAQAALSNQMRAAAEAAQALAVPEPSVADEPELEDFPIGTTVPDGASALPAAPVPAPSGDGEEEIDYWDEQGEKDGPAEAAALAAAASEEAFISGDEFIGRQELTPEPDADVISAESVFADEEPEIGDQLPRTGSPATAEFEPPESAAVPTWPPASDRTPADVPPGSFPASSALDDDELEPISLDGIEVETPAIEQAEEKEPEEDLAERRELRSAQTSVEDLQFDVPPSFGESDEPPLSLDASFDAPLGETQTLTENGGQQPVRHLEDADEPLPDDAYPEESLSSRAEDHPLGEPSPEPAESLFSETVTFMRNEQEAERPAPADSEAPSPSIEVSEEVEFDETHHDEILIATGRPPADQTSPLAGQEISSESTMVDGKARHKAVFQDQLARGLAAMDKGHYKDAVKHLSVAHAMNPNDDYTLAKLRQAREKRDADE